MKRVGYVILLVVMMIISVLMYVFDGYFKWGLTAFVFAEVALFGTLIIFEIKELKSGDKEKNDCGKCDQSGRSKEPKQDKLSDVNIGNNAVQNDERVDRKNSVQESVKDVENIE